MEFDPTVSLIAQGQLDSSGGFTIDRQRALAKIQSSSLSQPDFWILKIVQAAVASGAESLAVRTGRGRIEVAFQTGEDWTAAELEAAFFNPSRKPGVGSTISNEAYGFLAPTFASVWGTPS